MKRIATAFMVLALSAVMLSAADASGFHQQFSDALAAGDASKAMSAYDDLQERALKELNNEQKRYEKALDAGNMAKAQDALLAMRSIKSSLSMTREESDTLLSLILQTDNEKEKSGNAAWLYRNSPYYSPKVTYDWSAEGENVSYRFSRSISVAPGSEITLPTASDIGADPAIAGVLEGWGVTRDKVMYQPGEVISAPYTSQTYYAIWKTAVVFEDGITGFSKTYEGTASGESYQVPVLEAPDDSYVFAGWVDRSDGEYIAPDEEEYVLSGNGASFEALWKKVEISGLSAMPYDTSSLPVNTQLGIGFQLSNKGNENLRNSRVELTAGEGVDVQIGSGRVPSLPGGRNADASGLRIVITEPGDHDLEIAFTDRDGDTWSEIFTVTAI